jgi:hypothetical protein
VRTDGRTDSEANSRLLRACSVCQLSARLRRNAGQRNVGLAVSSVVNRALQYSHVTDTRKRMAADTSFLPSGVDKGEWSASRAGRLTIGERTSSIY